MDAAMITFRDTLMQGSSTQTVTTVTTKWQATEATFDVKAPQPLLCACFLKHIEKSNANAGPVTWQLCGCYLDIPTTTIRAGDGARIFFPTVLRDFSGALDVGVTEPAALRLAGGLTPSEFEEAFNEGSLQFGRCNVRGGRSARDNGEVTGTRS